MSSEGCCPRCSEPLGISGTCYACAVQDDIDRKHRQNNALAGRIVYALSQIPGHGNADHCQTLDAICAVLNAQ